jgi:hypothetical protein
MQGLYRFETKAVAAALLWRPMQYCAHPCRPGQEPGR